VPLTPKGTGILRIHDRITDVNQQRHVTSIDGLRWLFSTTGAPRNLRGFSTFSLISAPTGSAIARLARNRGKAAPLEAGTPRVAAMPRWLMTDSRLVRVIQHVAVDIDTEFLFEISGTGPFPSPLAPFEIGAGPFHICA
jgi:hypothetical protein